MGVDENAGFDNELLSNFDIDNFEETNGDFWTLEQTWD